MKEKKEKTGVSSPPVILARLTELTRQLAAQHGQLVECRARFAACCAQRDKLACVVQDWLAWAQMPVSEGELRLVPLCKDSRAALAAAGCNETGC